MLTLFLPWISQRWALLSSHFKHTMGLVLALTAILFGVFVWMERKIDKTITTPFNPHHVRLHADDKETISFDEKTHRIIVETASGTVKMYARNPTVRIKKDGKVTVDQHLLGFELRPYIGIGFSDTIRAMAGVQPFYWGAFDASVALGLSVNGSGVFAKPYVAAGYNCWGNMSVNTGVNPAGIKDLDVILFMSVKL